MQRLLIEEQWDDYKEKVLPKDAPSIQLQETRRAFYAGAYACLRIQEEIVDTMRGVDEGAGILSTLYQEVRDFAEGVVKGSH